MARKPMADPELPKWSQLDPDEVLDQYPTKFLTCRGGHDWPRKGQGVIWVLVAKTMVERRCTCRSCGSTQIKLIDRRSWRRLRPQARIRYVKGYLTTGTGLTQADFEATAYSRDFDDAMIAGRTLDSKEDA